MGGPAFIFPGQGSQYVGMGKALWEADDAVKGLYAAASELSGIDVAAVSFEGPEEELNRDLTAQVAVYTCNEACRLAALGLGLVPAAVTGYSMGFYSALVAAGCFTFVGGLRAVIRAGELALEAAGRRPGTMAAVIGLSLAEVEGVCAEASGGTDGEVWVSNINAARQILVSGEPGAVHRAVSLSLKAGALSAFKLTMGAAYHSPMMETASAEFSKFVESMDIAGPKLPVVSYIDAGYLKGPDEIKVTLFRQLCSRVLWKDTVLRLTADGIDSLVETGPGEALTRMVRWVDRDVKAASMEFLMYGGDTLSEFRGALDGHS